ncbi:GyrI-like domain-containing protein [Microbacterium sp. SS28]|uniref:GyrI-like domain-containing protein n=1 Tax=Microbacterium sp. SS28 TaxID=2919948 RepID=UPI001FA9F4D9|nr:GyrI-like domain-containing protein [Microbacterium sp. SS28]
MDFMTEAPKIVVRPEIPYVAITAEVTMDDIGAVVPPLTSEVFDWLAAKGIAPAGAAFWKYDVIDMERRLVIETGVPVAEQVEGDSRVRRGLLPAGRYATVIHVGHPQTLMSATARLLEWGREQGLTWDVAPTPNGDRWGCRLETYLDEPGQDMNEWATELAFKLADD